MTDEQCCTWLKGRVLTMRKLKTVPQIEEQNVFSGDTESLLQAEVIC